jgi:signal transduction histidine kinase
MNQEPEKASHNTLASDQRGGQPYHGQETAESGRLALSQLPLALIAHELRAPLNRINGFLDLLLTEEGPAEAEEEGRSQEQRHYLQRARASGEQLYILLENLLCLLRATGGQLRLSSQRVLLEELIDSAIEELEHTARLRRLQVEKRLPPDLPEECRRLRTDGQRARQVVRNLLANALAYTPPGGQVTVEVAETRLNAGRPGVVLSICDSGVGIRPEALPHIFEPFYRAEPPPGSEQLLEGGASGLGLGLSVARLLVDQLGGTILVQSTPGSGTTVSVTLPTLT